jgi:ABC-type glycerol-3-phosphate transport system permease component
MNSSLGELLQRTIIYASAALLVVFCGFPLIWMIITSVKPSSEVLSQNFTLLPSHLTFSAYGRLFAQTEFVRFFVNSFIVSLITTIVTVFFGTLAAYAITRYEFRGKRTFSTTILFIYMFAPIMIIVPLYVVLRGLGLIDTRAGLVLAYTTFALPFSLWMLRSFFKSIPIDLELAALVDGASRAQAVRYVIFPLAFPGVVAVSVFTFLVAWNDYLFARVLIASSGLKTLTVGVQDMVDASATDWGMLMAAGVLITLPVFLAFLFLQRYLVAGWGTGGVKG